MKHRFEVLDIFRGLFASLVFLYHLSPFAKTPVINNSFVANADMFVDFFFVLSGFVIAYSYQAISTIDEVKLFLKKRFLRIYPLHLFMLILFVAVEFAKNMLTTFVKVNNPNDPDNNIFTFITSLFLLNSTPIFDPKDVSWNIPSWSISAEMIAYIIFAALTLTIFVLRADRAKNWIYFLMVLVAAGALISIQNGFKIDFTFDYGFLRGIVGFFLGAICVNIFRLSYSTFSLTHSSWFTAAEILAVIAIIVLICNGQSLKDIGFVYEALFFASIYIFAFERGIISRSIKNIKLLQNLGKYSYSIYMSHALMISIFNVVFIRILKFPETAYSYLFIVNFLIIYIFSAGTYKYIEMRFAYKSKPRTRVEVIDQKPELKTP
ncbi:acyltransferase family protein [Dyadobacter arcticus]|uniref:Peptidoglycan/LPS O-acetylase OafA/YrhL n=1 Tax=Dyadobacter arcticus TaxID=1078754 RepID=A0ABX0UNE6_9BACT|nr:acyltransferase [Dyadobacter arcticus]NIJ53654.1 peptidoglycan/LPS O-acetylase OafA/YrhL [Dyadobacter arcticus]